MSHLVHWDDVPVHLVERDPMRARWSDLGAAAGSVGVGVKRVAIAAWDHPTPPHLHGAEEETFFVLRGSGLSWQDGLTYAVAAGDCLVHPPSGPAHTLIAGSEGLEALAFGTRVAVEVSYLPRAGVAWLSPTWVEAGGDRPWDREAAAGPLPVPPPTTRPDAIVHLDDPRVPMETLRDGSVTAEVRHLSRAGGARLTSLRWVRVPPGRLGSARHCHGASEELIVVVAGEGELLLGDGHLPVRAGHVISRPPATGVAHALRAGVTGLDYLAYATREPNDIVYYPETGAVALRGVGVVGRLTPLAGEEGG
jgi:uncharacterized cupin superfamily protein